MKLINSDVLYEMLEKEHIDVIYRRTGIPGEWKGYCFYTSDTVPEDQILYICPFDEHMPAADSAAIYCGQWEETDIPAGKEYFLCRNIAERQLLNLLEKFFRGCREIEMAVNLSATSVSPLCEIIEAAVDYFHVPCYYHDARFFVRAYDRRTGVEHNPDIVYSEQYKCYMFAPSMLNDLRINSEFQPTLHAKGANQWIDPITEATCIYQNQFYYEQYRGRFLVLQNYFSRGTAHAVEFFSFAIERILASEAWSNFSITDPISNLLKRYVEDKIVPESTIALAAAEKGWHMHGRYLGGMIRFYQNELNQHMAWQICNSIFDMLPHCALYNQGNSIYLLIDMKKSRLNTSDIRVQMSKLVRESLLKVAISDEFSELGTFPVYLQQTEACLDYMLESGSTDWFCEFHQVVLPYWLHNGTGQIPLTALTAPEITKLKEYDALYGTDLLNTLKVYIENDRSLIDTSRVLQIHRTTVPHRLEKIRELTGLDLDNKYSRLHLFMSFAVSELP